jgi:[protein-PII] uridylyltransferase
MAPPSSSSLSPDEEPHTAAQRLLERTHLIDAQVLSEWPGLPGCALCAVGGYGRRELFPCSDVDLLIVSSRTDLREPLAPFLRALWDAGMRVSQSVHTVEECNEVDDLNIELSISLLDRRLLTGDAGLFEKLRDPRREQLAPALARITRERHAKFGNTVYHLEPNIKDAPGGLRDLQVLRWLAKLSGVSIVVPPHDLIAEIRTALHLAAGRDQNILNFLMQDECARTLHFADPSDLMGAWYREARPLHQACLRRLDELEARRSSLLAAFRDRAARLSNSDFSVVNGSVYFRIPPSDPHLFIRIFEFIARHGLPLAPDAEDRIGHFGDPVSITWEELHVILDLPHAAQALRAMHDTGFLLNIFPELAGIESLVIRDFYHRYTVDEHTLVAVTAAIELRKQTNQFGELARETPDYALLLVALLFHDSGKGVPSEHHAEASVEIAERALKTIGMPAAEMETVLFLIRAHLEMSRLMTTRDPADLATAATLAAAVGTAERLKLLTALTYCDISAVHPGALTPWRTTLLWRLYTATSRHLTLGLQTDLAAEGLPARYQLTNSAEQIAEHHRMEMEERRVVIKREGSSYRLTVVTPDRPFLMADIAGALASFGMNILRAEVFINDRDCSINIFRFDDPMRTLDLNPSELGRLEELIQDAIAQRKNVAELLRGRARNRAVAYQPPRVSTENQVSANATLFEITAEDRPGLLYHLSRFFSERGCNIETVLIDTEGRKAIDVFYVTRAGQPLDESETLRMREQLQHISA